MKKIYKGQVFSGKGVATTRVKQNLEVYQQESNMNLVPGTLNLRLTEDFKIPEGSVYISPERIKPIEKERGVTIVPARIRAENVMILIPDRPIYKKNIIEIIAPFNIRQKFCLKDGDGVEVEI